MSNAVQLTAEISVTNKPAKAHESRLSGDSSEFSRLLDSASSNGGKEHRPESNGTRSENSRKRIDSDHDGVKQSSEARSDTNQRSSDASEPGKNTNADGKELPPDHKNAQSALAGTNVLNSEAMPGSALEEIAAHGDLLARAESVDKSTEVLGASAQRVAEADDPQPAEANSDLKPNVHQLEGLLVGLESESGRGSAVALKEEIAAQAETTASAPLVTNRGRLAANGIKDSFVDGADLFSSDLIDLEGLENATGDRAGKSGPAILAEAEVRIREQLLSRMEAGQSLAAGSDKQSAKDVSLEMLLKDLAPSTLREMGAAQLSSSGLSASAQSSMATSLAGLGSAQTSLLGLTQVSNTGVSNQLLSLGTSVNDPAWADDFAVRIRTLVSGNVQQATLNLRPAELGAIEVNLSTEGNETRVHFTVQNAAVRDVLEASMPRLREVFQDSGLSLTDADVRDQSAYQQTNGEGQRGNERSANIAIQRASNQSLEPGLSDSELTLARWDGDQLRGGVDTFI